MTTKEQYDKLEHLIRIMWAELGSEDSRISPIQAITSLENLVGEDLLREYLYKH